MGVCHKYWVRKYEETLPARGGPRVATGTPMGLIVSKSLAQEPCEQSAIQPIGLCQAPFPEKRKTVSRPSPYV